MYKGASSNLQHRHRVNLARPTGGMDGLDKPFDDALIPSAANMGIEECRAELVQLGIELARNENELAIAKRGGSAFVISQMGHRIQAIVQRRSIINTRLRSLHDEEDRANPKQHLVEAVRQLAPPDTAKAIFKLARQLHKEARA